MIGEESRDTCIPLQDDAHFNNNLKNTDTSNLITEIYIDQIESEMHAIIHIWALPSSGFDVSVSAGVQTLVTGLITHDYQRSTIGGIGFSFVAGGHQQTHRRRG